MTLEVPDDAHIPLLDLLRFFAAYGYGVRAEGNDHLVLVPLAGPKCDDAPAFARR